MNVSALALLLCILVWRSQSEDHVFEIEDWNTTRKKSNDTIKLTRGTNVTFVCKCNGDCKISWLKNNSIVMDFHCQRGTSTVRILYKTCTSSNITLFHVDDQHSGRWFCRNGEHYSKTQVVEVIPPESTTRQSVHVLPTTETSESQTKRTRLTTGEKESGSGMTTIRQHIQTTGDEATSNNFLLPVIGAAVCGVLIITIIIIVVVVKRKQSLKGEVETDPRQRTRDPEVELIDADGQYASIGTMAASVAVPVIEPNPMYESYEGNQNKNQYQNRDEDGGISFAQGGEGDVYSVVNKPDRSTAQEAPSVVDTGGDVYSVVQKKKQDPPATNGVQAGTPGHDQGISDVYSVVQKPGKTS